MAKRDDRADTRTSDADRAGGPTTGDVLERRVLDFAEQLGRLVGTVQAKAEGWLDRARLTEQLTQVRDSASNMLEHLADGYAAGSQGASARPKSARPAAGASAATKKPATAATKPATAGTKQATTGTKQATAKSRSGGKVDAPGKRHRKPIPAVHGVKHSDERIAKMRLANEVRKRSRG